MKRILGLAGLLLIFAACEQFGIDTKETLTRDPARSDVKVFASIEQPASPETKVYADDSLKVLWHADDTISFFNKLTLNDKWRFTGETGDNGGFFEQIAAQVGTGNEMTYYCAVYPYRSTTRISNNDVLTVTLPAEQKYAANSFGPNANTMIAVAPTSIFSFKNVCGYLSFKLYGEGVSVSSITLKGNNNEPLAGKGTIPMAIDSLPKITMSDVATKEITLVCDPPVALGSSAADFTEFWMVVPPIVFESGFTITIRDASGMTIRKSLNASLEIVRSKIKRMAPLEVTLPIPEAVDLGLPSGLKWASFNVGASAPEEYGDYFAWGETEPKDDYGWETYTFELGVDQDGPFSKYVTNSLYGNVDNKTLLDLEDDAAHVNLGNNWRTPTDVEWEEIKECCSWIWTTENGVNGYRVTSTTNGNSIFLPAAGNRFSDGLHNVESRGFYWSSSLTKSSIVSRATYFGLYSINFGVATYSRYFGHSIRPVYAPNHVESISLDRNRLTMLEEETTTLIATMVPSAILISGVTWSSDDCNVATVDQNGTVTAVSPGRATITVTSTDGCKLASCEVIVGKNIFQDNFDWMAPYVQYYNEKNPTKHIGRSVEDSNASGNAPNAYTDATLTECGLMDAFKAQGYVDINRAVTSLYPQDCYWKMGKTRAHTGLQLPPVDYTGKATITFDWSPHMNGIGNIDKVNVVVEVVTNGTSVVSAPFPNVWEKGQLHWETVSTTIDITPESKIIIRPEYLSDHDGVTQMRWYLDNIKITGN